MAPSVAAAMDSVIPSVHLQQPQGNNTPHQLSQKKTSHAPITDVARYLIANVPPAKVAWSTIQWGQKAMSVAASSVISSPPRNPITSIVNTETPGTPTTLVNVATPPLLPTTPNGTHFEIPPPYSVVDSETAVRSSSSSSATSVDAHHSPRLMSSESSEVGDIETAQKIDSEDDGLMAYDPTMNVMESAHQRFWDMESILFIQQGGKHNGGSVVEFSNENPCVHIVFVVKEPWTCGKDLVWKGG
ncbi:hypothetical protein BC829DRAFT_105013 [Chytridium lagenaria]|nr:hypothetical protein BC829DRAFT_105013 [Chytridium lagenaria]